MKYIIILCIINLLFFLLLNYINIILKKNIKFNKVYLFFLFVSAVIIAYCTIPNELDDLSRYFIHIDNFSIYGIKYINDFPYKENAVVTLLFYLLSIVGDYHLLPVIVVTIYSIAVFLLMKKSNIENNSYLMSIIIITLFSFEYLNTIISGVRFPLATALFVIILLYDDNTDIKYNILYAIPLMIHSSYILILGLVLLTKLQMKFKFKLKTWIISIPYITILIALIFPKNILIFSDVFNRLLIYINPSFSLQYIDIRLLGCYLVLFFIIIYLYYKINKSLNVEINLYVKNSTFYYFFFKNLLLILLGLLPFISIFTRFVSLLILLFIPLINQKNNLQTNERKILLISLLIICLGVFAYRMVNAINYWNFLFF